MSHGPQDTGYFQRSQYGGPSRGGHGSGSSSQRSFVDMKGKLIQSTGLPPHLKAIQPTVTQSWKPFPDKQENIKISVRPGQATQFERKICLRVNYFPINIKLPANIYRYAVDATKVIDESKEKKPPKAGKSSKSKDKPENEGVEKKVLPRHLRFAIHKKLIEQLRKAFSDSNPNKVIGIISDRSTSLYSTQQLEPSVQLELNVEIPPDAGENGRLETFRVIVSPTIEKVNTKGMEKFMNNMKDVPLTLDLKRLDQIYNTLMKNLNSNRYVPIGRSSLICFDENNSFSLGGGLLNFKGYDATVEITNGWKPFLNVHGKIKKCVSVAEDFELMRRIYFFQLPIVLHC